MGVLVFTPYLALILFLQHSQLVNAPGGGIFLPGRRPRLLEWTFLGLIALAHVAAFPPNRLSGATKLAVQPHGGNAERFGRWWEGSVVTLSRSR